jgi:hypothetical protein
MLDIVRFRGDGTCAVRDPFPFAIGHGLLPAHMQGPLLQDFPRYRGAGFFPYAAEDCGPSMRALVDEVTSADFSNAVGDQLGIPDLARFPTLVTLCRSLNRRHGTIHTDSSSKVATALVYLSPGWPETSDGCLRFLAAIDDIDATLVPEVRPVYGTVAAFKRCDNSFHGHLPCEGERPVVQVAWVVSEAEKLRKIRRGRASRLFKKLSGGLDRWFGSGRDRSASHRG